MRRRRAPPPTSRSSRARSPPTRSPPGARRRRGKHNAGGAFKGTSVANLQALGRAHAYGRATLGDWGTLVISRHAVERTSEDGIKGYTGTAIAVDITLTAAHGGLPAGTEIQVGYAVAGAQTAPPVVPETGPAPGDRPQLLPPATGAADRRAAGDVAGADRGAVRLPGLRRHDDHGRLRRPDRGSGWERGAYVYGRLGQPVVAVSEGTLYSVGWNHAAGNKLWLRDGQGNQFLYTHLSAFSKLASNGAHVRAGQVIGFMGSTGNVGRAACAPLLRGAPRLDALPRPGRRRRPGPLPRRAGGTSRASRSRSAPFWAPKVPGHDQRPGARGGADRRRATSRPPTGSTRRRCAGPFVPGVSGMTASGRSSPCEWS